LFSILREILNAIKTNLHKRFVYDLVIRFEKEGIYPSIVKITTAVKEEE